MRRRLPGGSYGPRVVSKMRALAPSMTIHEFCEKTGLRYQRAQSVAHQHGIKFVRGYGRGGSCLRKDRPWDALELTNLGEKLASLRPVDLRQFLLPQRNNLVSDAALRGRVLGLLRGRLEFLDGVELAMVRALVEDVEDWDVPGPAIKPPGYNPLHEKDEE
jgi:hypothetical protein